MESGQDHHRRDLRMSEIIGALSYALDLTEGQAPGHCLRCCWIGMNLAHEIDLPEAESLDLYYTLLLKDAGCSSNAARLWELYGGDDRLIKDDFKRVNSQSLFQLGHFVLNHTAPNKALRERFYRLFNLFRHGDELATELVATRCERGADIALQLGFSSSVADGVRYLDEHWNGQGRPYGLSGDSIPLQSRIALLAQVVDVFQMAGGPDSALLEVRKRTGQWFDPSLTSALEQIASHSDFWKSLNGKSLARKVAELEPGRSVVLVDENQLDNIAEAFGRVVDAKSPYTYGHSTRVAAFAQAMAVDLDIPENRRCWVRRGALLHDIGKLGISNSVLDKPGPLNPEEWKEMRAHPRYTEEILARIVIFDELSRIAGAHHERFDGGGYPYGLIASEISLETRIITTADIFDAITADRPYRKAIPVSEGLRIMRKQIGKAIDIDCLNSLENILPEFDLA
ncbi:HD-GYP domain-containing protein [Acidihalobacter prosperus]